MSTIERLNQFSHRIFNTSQNEQSTSRTSNPFAASNFQKNILTEDVFESSKAKQNDKVSFTGNLTASSKRIYSTFVGSINDMGSKFYEGIESIKAIYGRVKDSVINTWNKIQEIGNKEVNVNINLDGAKELLTKEYHIKDIASAIVGGKNREITRMSKMDPHSEVKPMFQQALEALEADMVMVA